LNDVSSPCRAGRIEAPPPAMAPITGPPEPGQERIEWLAQRITYLTGFQKGNLAPHAARRSAARRVLARVAGYEPERAEDDALYMASASVYLASLNEYARRVLDGGEESRDAVL
ncbi:MAG: hypothetical protein LC798_20855, partial [Chloroflexi bacterium]|nr:hypothetical protein [Chloroflexota bacterium]